MNNTELYHYGVMGMKWGVRKEVYKSMNRQQRKEQRKKYYGTPEGKVERATTIGTLLGGPLVGIVAGLITSKKLNDVSDQTVSKGKNTVNKFKNAKIETDEQKVMRLKEAGQINPNTEHIFDQDGNLFMVIFNDN